MRSSRVSATSTSRSSPRRSGRFGTGETVVVVDPIDGSLNAKRGIPFFAVSIAVAEARRMGDVHFGYVYDFGAGEEWIARRGEGATLNGEPLPFAPRTRSRSSRSRRRSRR